uniref:Odorant receptor n=1 Tax=Phlebotomus papatasi TaxID=29031 RepID=A0A3F2ZEP3_PHLPP
MADHIECYKEYLAFEEGIRFVLKALSFSFWKGRIWNNFGRVLIPFLCLYFSSCCFEAFFIPTASLLQQMISIMTSVAIVQIFTKITSILYSEKDLNNIFDWLRDIHRVSQFETVTNSAKIHLKRSINVTKILPKILCGSYYGVVLCYLLYFTYHDAIVVTVIGFSPKENQSLILYKIHQILSTVTPTIFLCISDYIVISIAFYLIGVINILQDMIKCLNNPEFIAEEKTFINSLYILHCEIIEKFANFVNFCYYIFTVQHLSNTCMMVSIFFILGKSQEFVLYPIFAIILVQFGILCCFGEIICAKTENIFKDLYMTKWYELSIKDQQKFLILMHGSQRSFGFKAAGMYDVNLMMFVKVIKISYSCCAILYSFT